MARRSTFTIIYAPETYKHLDWIEPKYHRLVQTTIREQLAHTPGTETRNRKPLEEPASFGATWELRFGPKNSFRVFYDVNHEEKTVSVLAFGVKEGNRLFIGGEEFEL
jgi:mRNA-degrading endonuclease RelE of RelBE toxin-antitoxin system